MNKEIFFHDKLPELKKLKSIFSNYSCKNLPLWPSLAPSIYVYQQNKSFGTSSFKLLRILKFLFFKEKLNPSAYKKGKILASILIDRKDHHALWEKYFSSFSKDDLVFLDSFQEGKRDFKSLSNRFYPSFPNFFKLANICLNLRKNHLSKIMPSFLDRIYLAAHVLFNERKINYLSNLLKQLQPKSYIAYSSYRQNDETILTQLMKKERKKTFTFQNYSLSEHKDFNSEAITYENFISDYFLLWGESSKKILQKFISPDKLIVIGNTLYGKVEKTKSKEFKPKKCTLFLSHRQFNKSNFDLINLLNAFAKSHSDIKFSVSLHPDSQESEFLHLIKEKNISILSKKTPKEEILRNSDFLILHNSSMSIEGLKYQIPIFRFKDNSTLEKDLPENEFSTLNELQNCYKEMFNKKNYKNFIQSCLKYYNSNFFQTKSISLAKNFRNIILKKTN